MSDRPSLVYLCNAIDERTKAERAVTTDSPAATNKVFALTDAMRLAGMRAMVLSMGRGRQNGSGRRHGARACRVQGRTVYYAAFWHCRVLTHVITALSLAAVLIALMRRQPDLRVLAYNRSSHYLPALLAARLMGRRVYLDLEDGFAEDEGGLLHRLQAYPRRKLFDFLCADGAMVATSALAAQIGQADPLVCYGISAQTGGMPDKAQSDRLHVLFSGTLLESVGSRLLPESLHCLLRDYPAQAQKLKITVSGKGPCAEVLAEQAKTLDPALFEFRGSVSRAAYLDLLARAQVGLSLRLSAFGMFATTFPSKVIEYADHGLLVVATPSADVPDLFAQDALYLQDETPQGLARLLAWMADNPDQVQAQARRGHDRVRARCSPEAVGAALRRLMGGP